jgi:hypothetical protein
MNNSININALLIRNYLKDKLKMLKLDEIYNWVVNKFGEICGWVGLVLIHGSTVPATYGAIKGEAVILPPLSMVILIWSGLLLFFIRSAIMKDKLYMLTIGIGFFLQSVMLGFLVLK